MRRLILLPVLAACGEPAPGAPSALPEIATDSAEAALAPPRRPRLWYTCGDPVCRGYTGPWPGVPDCGAYLEGDRCPTSALGRTCDPQDMCNRRLECRRDPGTGPCPISKREHKRDIDYLDPADVRSLHDQLVDTKLATWRYNWDPSDGRPHLGFIIDDQPGSPAVAADGEHVDLYGFTTMAVAALQEQSRRIAALEAELAALKATRP